jgi:hypothetical protein
LGIGEGSFCTFDILVRFAAVLKPVGSVGSNMIRESFEALRQERGKRGSRHGNRMSTPIREELRNVTVCRRIGNRY